MTVEVLQASMCQDVDVAKTTDRDRLFGPTSSQDGTM